MSFPLLRIRLILFSLLAVSFGVGMAPAHGLAQASGENDAPVRYRIGVVLGGTSLVGLVGEVQQGRWAGEVVLGTLSFRDVSLAAAAKYYASGGNLKPYAGLGFWTLIATSEERTGVMFAVRAPLGLNFRLARGHDVGLEVGLNRAVWIRRLDPEDPAPPNSSLVPLPGLYYRYGLDE
ncbi:MAG: hypothetical protein WEA09_08000 [Gemmatimonadota bacterium]